MSEQLTIEKPAPYWTEERTQALIDAYNNKEKLRDLAAKWGVSVGTITGKIKRLKQSKRIACRFEPHLPNQFKRKRPRPRKATSHTQRVDVTPQLKVIERQEQPMAPAPEREPIENIIPIGQRCSILELADDKCHWPIGDPHEPDFFFCGGRAVEGFVYCGYHARIAFVPRKS